MTRIRAILKEEDIAGYVVLHEPGHSEYFLGFDPSWSVVQLERDEDGNVGIRLRSKLEEYGGDKDRQKRDLEASLNMLHHLEHQLPIHAGIFGALLERAGELMEIKHGEAVHVPYDEPH